MTGDLFRREALEARKEDWMGSVRLTTTRLAWPATLLAVAAVTVAVLLLALGSYTRKERVQGRLMPSAGLLLVTAPADGRVANLRVHEGQSVAAQAPLFDIVSVQDTAQGPGLNVLIGVELERQQRQLRQDLADAKTGARASQNELQQRIASLSKQAKAAEARLRIRQQQAASAHAMLRRIQPLREQQMVSAIQMQEYASRALDADAQAESAAQENLETQRQLSQTQAEIETLRVESARQRSQVARELSDLSQAAARNRVQGALQLRASSAGVVAGLAVDAGQTVTKGQRVLSLIPATSRLRAELWIPSRAVGTLRAGTRVAIRYDAFPYQTYGQRYGRVIEISRSALTPEEILARSGLQLEAPAYRVLVALDRDPTPARALPLRAGMTLQADLLLERRRLYRFLFDPLRSLKSAQAKEQDV